MLQYCTKNYCNICKYLSIFDLLVKSIRRILFVLFFKDNLKFVNYEPFHKYEKNVKETEIVELYSVKKYCFNSFANKLLIFCNENLQHC